MVCPCSGIAVIRQFAVHSMSAERAKGEWGDEFFGTGGHHHAHLSAGFYQFTNDKRGFVCGDAPGDAQDNAAARKGSHVRDQLSLCSKRRLRRSSRSRRISSCLAASAANSSSVGMRKYTLPSSSSLMATLCAFG